MRLIKGKLLFFWLIILTLFFSTHLITFASILYIKLQAMLKYFKRQSFFSELNELINKTKPIF